MLYKYVKAKPKKRIRRPVVVSFFLMSIGVGILLWVAWPIVSFTVFSSSLFGTTITTPLVDTSPPGAKIAFAAPMPEAASSVDTTNANLWYPASPQKKIVTPVNTYMLTIPKLKIENAMVTIAGDDLNKSLVHYGGTGIPGQYGNAVIFGHSVLPQFFDPKNYRTIFSTLPTLVVGDEIFITYDSVTYKYKIFDMVVREPNDLGALEQQYDDSYITLITCVPPGTLWKRLNVKAKLTRL